MAYKEQLKLKEQLDNCLNNTQGSDVQLQRCLDDKRNLQTELNMLKLAGGGGGGGGGNSAQLAKARKDFEDCDQKFKNYISDKKKEIDILRAEINRLKK